MFNGDRPSGEDHLLNSKRVRLYLAAVAATVIIGLAGAATIAMASQEGDTRQPKAPDGQSSSHWIRQFGTPSTDGAEGIDHDDEGNIYVVGYTWVGQAALGGVSGYDAFINKFDADGNEIWRNNFGTQDSDYAGSVAVSNDGSVYVLGRTNGAFPGQTNIGSEDVFLRKLDSQGNEEWTRQFGTELRDEPSDVEVDDQGNIYVAGVTRTALPGQIKTRNEDAYVRKYDSDGNETWTHQFGTTGTDQISHITLDNRGHIYVVGPTSGAFPGQTWTGEYDAYLRKLDVDGNTVWTRQFGTEETDTAIDVAVDGQGHVYVVGFIRIATTGQRVGVVQNSLAHSFDVDGNNIWNHEFGTIDEDFATNVVVDNNGDIYVAGRTGGTFPGQVNFGGNDVFLRKLSSDNKEIWTYQFGSSAGDNVRDMMLDDAGNLYLAGRTNGVLAGQEQQGLSDAFLIKLTADFSPASGPNVIPNGGISCNRLTAKLEGSLSIGWILMGLMLPALTLAKLASRGSQG
jgi:hypothetical protein